MKFTTKPSLELGLLLGFTYNFVFWLSLLHKHHSSAISFYHSSGRPYLFYPLCPDMPAVPVACNFNGSCQKWRPWPFIILWGVSLLLHQKTMYFCVFSISGEHTQTPSTVQLDARQLQTHTIPPAPLLSPTKNSVFSQCSLWDTQWKQPRVSYGAGIVHSDMV